MQRLNSKNGFTFIEAMVLIFLVVVVVVTFFSVFSYGTKSIIDSEKKLAAAEVASEKIEVVHNLDYGDIGTTDGTVQGILSDREVVSRNTGTVYVFTSVQYFDDPYDGISGENDYKKVRIKASWEDNIDSDKSVVFVSTFLPQKTEESE